MAPEDVILGEEFTESIEVETTRNMVGGRVVVETPVVGLRLGASAYTGHEAGLTRRSGFGAQVEYLAGPWSARSEYAHGSVKDNFEANAFYAEGGLPHRSSVAGCRTVRPSHLRRAGGS